jgi:hypothetical protein
MEIHEEFTAWAVERGVKINGVAAHKFEGRGLGIIATKKHEVCIDIESVSVFLVISIILSWLKACKYLPLLLYVCLDILQCTMSLSLNHDSDGPYVGL